MTTVEKVRLLRADQVAKRINYSVPSVYRLAARGVLPSVRIGAGLRFREDDIEKLLESRGGDD